MPKEKKQKPKGPHVTEKGHVYIDDPAKGDPGYADPSRPGQSPNPIPDARHEPVPTGAGEPGFGGPGRSGLPAEARVE